jgi:hypothetical protein
MATEDDIQIFLEEIQELTDNLRSLTRTVISGEEALAKALNLDTKALKENTKAVDQNTDQVAKEAKARADLVKKQREQYEQNKREIHQKRQDRDVVTDLMREFGQGTSATQVLRQQFEKGSETTKILTAGFEGLIKSVTAYGAAIYKGERGMLPAAKAATAAVKPLQDLAEIVGTAVTVLSFFLPAARAARLLGLALVGVSKAVGVVNDLNEKAAEQTDNLFKSFNRLSQSGIGLTRGLNDVFGTLQTLGLSAAELEEFNKLLSNNVATLGLFGATAAGGVKKFSDAAGQLVKDYGRELEMMGITREEQREAMMSYMALQARTGQIELKTAQQLAVEGAKFAKEMDLMAQLTGTSREAQQKAIDANMADARFRSAQRAAELRGDKEEQSRLERANRLAAMLRAAGMNDLATGTLQFAAGGGVMSTPEAVRAAMQLGLHDALDDPNTAVAEILQKSLGFAQGQIDALSETTRFTGQIDVIQGNIAQLLDANIRLQRIQELAAQKGMTLDEFLKDEQNLRALGDKELQKLVDGGRSQLNAAMMMDSTVRAFGQTGNTFATATKLFANAVSAMPGAKIAGGPAGTGGPKTAGSTAPGAAGRTSATGAAIDDLANKIVRAEGGSVTARNPYSSASGLGQITRGRYQDLVKNSKSGSALKGTTFEQYQSSESLQKEALNEQIENLRSYLDSKGLSSTDAAVYMAHVFGPAGARAVLTHSDSVPVTSLFNKGIIDSNPAIFRGVTNVGELKKVISDKMGGSGYQFGGVASGPRSGYTAVLHGTEAIIPLQDGRSIPIEMPDLSNNMREQVNAVMSQVSRLDDMVELMRRQLDTSQKILQMSSS